MLLHCWFARAYSGTAFNVHHLRPLGEISPQSGSPSSNFNLFAYLAILHRIEATASSMKEHTHAPCHPSYPPQRGPWLAALDRQWVVAKRPARGSPDSAAVDDQQAVARPPFCQSANPSLSLSGYYGIVLSTCSACRSAPIYPRRTSTWGSIGALCGKSQVLPRFGEFLSTRPPSERCACLDSGEA